jgi:hypothetical protein
MTMDRRSKRKKTMWPLTASRASSTNTVTTKSLALLSDLLPAEETLCQLTLSRPRDPVLRLVQMATQ